MNGLVKCNEEKHEFAFFFESLSVVVQSTVSVGTEIVLLDESLFHRIKTVVRLVPGDGCVFFNRDISVLCTITEFIGKKQIRCVIDEKRLNSALVPEITFLLPLLKRDDYEQALYVLAELGVTTVQLVFTQKSRSSWDSKKDMERAHRIVISAAEQSKNFVYPFIKEPLLLSAALTMISRAAPIKLFFDPLGGPFLSVVDCKQLQNHYVLLVGPEGDLSSQEKEQIKKEKFIFCALTPTILRSVQAVSLGAGMVRSLVR